MAPALASGLCSNGACRGTHPAWFAPDRSGGQRVTGLRVYNSLTGEKELFVPREGNRVTWYTCGPTVYDVCHMGHARAYLTMDIIRRILEDYLGYEVFLQVNVTDIDDKIIKRARLNRLLDDFIAQDLPVDEVRVQVEAAMAAFEGKLKEKLLTLERPIAAGGREEDERTELLKQHLQKMSNFAALCSAVTQASATPDGEALARAAAEPLSEALDRERGATVTDHSIFDAHARRFEASWMEDMEALGVKPPDALTRVTEYVPEIVSFIEGIVARGLAYESAGSIYMDLAAFRRAGHAYPKLQPSKGVATAAEMEESEGSHTAGVGEKKGGGDFALWKASKAGEPAWASPWGEGRPGWHIECSVMASELLGANMDVHAGGVDLQFPHHDNELCQAEAFHGCGQWVNYFFHFGHLHIKGLKMAKSLKNFITIRQALSNAGRHGARRIRLMFLLQPWDKSIDYSDQTLDEAKNKEKTLVNYFAEVALRVKGNGWLGKPTKPGPAEMEFAASLAARQARAHAALLDNFNTPGAMEELLGIVADTHRYLHGPGAARPDALLLKKGAAYVTRMLRVFGVSTQPEFGLGDDSETAAISGGADAAAPVVDALAAFRDAVRAGARAAAVCGSDAGPADLLGLCDRLRDSTLVDLGIRLEDRPDGAVWRRDDPAEMRAEIEAKAAAAAEAAASKLARKMEAKRAEIAKEREAAVPPSELFLQPRHAAKFSPSALDAEGRPTLGGDGEPLSKAAKKEVDKLYARQAKEHEKHLAKLGKNPRTLQEMEEGLAAMYTEGREMLAAHGSGLTPETKAALLEQNGDGPPDPAPADARDAPAEAV